VVRQGCGLPGPSPSPHVVLGRREGGIPPPHHMASMLRGLDDLVGPRPPRSGQSGLAYGVYLNGVYFLGRMPPFSARGQKAGTGGRAGR
jgi:hypothetical protein